LEKAITEALRKTETNHGRVSPGRGNNGRSDVNKSIFRLADALTENLKKSGKYEVKAGKRKRSSRRLTDSEENIFLRLAMLKPEPDLSVIKKANGEQELACIFHTEAEMEMDGWHRDMLHLVHFKEIQPRYHHVHYILPCSVNQLLRNLGSRDNAEQFFYLIQTFGIRIWIKHSENGQGEDWVLSDGWRGKDAK